MPKGDGFGFTHLVEDGEDDEIDIGDARLDVTLQPHLSTSNNNNFIPSSGQGEWEGSGENGQQLSKGDNPVLQMDEEGDGGTGSGTSFSKKREIGNTNGTSQHSENLATSSHSDSGLNGVRGQNNSSQNNGTSIPQSAVQVQFSNTEGKVNVMQGQVMTRADGSHYIDTRGIQERWSEQERPLRQRRIRFLKIFSIISCVLFFPTGIPAVYYAFKTEKEFNEGIMRGNIDRAHKFAKRSERFTILSFIMTIVVAALVVALVERPYFSHHTAHRGTIVG